MAFSSSEVLAKFDDMSREFLYYLEKADFIRPTKLTRGKLDRRLYSEKDVEKIGLIWLYYQRGLSPKEAYKKTKAQIENEVSPGEIRLREAINHARAAGIELGGMSLEAFIALFSGAEDMLREDLARLIDHLAKEWVKKE